jgi:hypothetical protein
MLLNRRPDISVSFSWVMRHRGIVRALLTSFQSPAQSIRMLSSGQEVCLVICCRSDRRRDPIRVRATDNQGCARLQGYPRMITRSISTPRGLSLLTLWSSGDSGARHLSGSQLHSMRDEHARIHLRGRYAFALSSVSQNHPHSSSSPLRANGHRLTPARSLHGLDRRVRCPKCWIHSQPDCPFSWTFGESGTRSMLHSDGAGFLVPSKRLHSIGFARFVDVGRALCTHFRKGYGCPDIASLGVFAD